MGTPLLTGLGLRDIRGCTALKAVGSNATVWVSVGLQATLQGCQWHSGQRPFDTAEHESCGATGGN